MLSTIYDIQALEERIEYQLSALQKVNDIASRIESILLTFSDEEFGDKLKEFQKAEGYLSEITKICRRFE